MAILERQKSSFVPEELTWSYYLHFLGLDGLVNNAGIAIPGLIEWQSIELMKKTFEVNYWGTVRVTKIMLPLLKKSRGRIVNFGT